MAKKFKQEYPNKVEETLKSQGHGKDGFFYNQMQLALQDMAEQHAKWMEMQFLSYNSKPGEESVTFSVAGTATDEVTEDF